MPNQPMPQMYLTYDHISGLSSPANASHSQLNRFCRSLSFQRDSRSPNIAAVVRQKSPSSTNVVPPASDESQVQQWNQCDLLENPLDPFQIYRHPPPTQSLEPPNCNFHELHSDCLLQPGYYSPISPYSYSTYLGSSQSASSGSRSTLDSSGIVSAGTDASGFSDAAYLCTTPAQITPVELSGATLNVAAELGDSVDSSRASASEDGFDCPIRAGPSGDALCQWKAPKNGLKDMSRVREHVGKHGLRCPDCGQTTIRHKEFVKHCNRKLNTGKCPDDLGDGTLSPGNVLPLAPEVIIAFFKGKKRNPAHQHEEWVEGYKALNPEWRSRALPSPFYAENIRRRYTDLGLPGRPSVVGPEEQVEKSKDTSSTSGSLDDALLDGIDWSNLDASKAMYHSDSSPTSDRRAGRDEELGSHSLDPDKIRLPSKQTSALRRFASQLPKLTTRPQPVHRSSRGSPLSNTSATTSCSVSPVVAGPSINAYGKRTLSTSSRDPEVKRQAKTSRKRIEELIRRITKVSEERDRLRSDLHLAEGEKRQLVDAIRELHVEVFAWDPESGETSELYNRVDSTLSRVRGLMPQLEI
ncbi:hypothetical protein AC578_3660 [Pseudocercospora eumusae]|uniref:Uncharacterized protein n=1 Tax=Pseudocercospora eumusae TaxID=321146 RepID=A0A139GXA5_9PEZI|nr:hypothetical protein AC578_3660 [Pseudocercospora eumusae]